MLKLHLDADIGGDIDADMRGLGAVAANGKERIMENGEVRLLAGR